MPHPLFSKITNMECVQRDLASFLTLDFRFLSLCASRSRSFSTVLCSKVRWLAEEEINLRETLLKRQSARPSEISFRWTAVFFKCSLPCVSNIPYRQSTGDQRSWMAGRSLSIRSGNHSFARCQRPEHLGDWHVLYPLLIRQQARRIPCRVLCHCLGNHARAPSLEAEGELGTVDWLRATRRHIPSDPLRNPLTLWQTPTTKDY